MHLGAYIFFSVRFRGSSFSFVCFSLFSSALDSGHVYTEMFLTENGNISLWMHLSFTCVYSDNENAHENLFCLENALQSENENIWKC